LAEPDGADEAGHSGRGDGRVLSGDELDRRRRELEAKLAIRRPASPQPTGSGKGSVAGFGNALKLSSEFIAGVVVGAAIGWFVDQYAGTSPWGLIIFLLLGFGAGVLNVLRSAGQVAEFGARPPSKADGAGDEK